MAARTGVGAVVARHDVRRPTSATARLRERREERGERREERGERREERGERTVWTFH